MRSGGRTRTSHIEIQNLAFCHLNYPGMVGTAGFEPTTPWSQARCSTKLSHVPILQGWTDELPARPGAGSEIRTRTLLVLSQAPLPIGLLRRGGGEGSRTLVVLLAEQVPDQHEQRPHAVRAGPRCRMRLALTKVLRDGVEPSQRKRVLYRHLGSPMPSRRTET